MRLMAVQQQDLASALLQSEPEKLDRLYSIEVVWQDFRVPLPGVPDVDWRRCS